MFSPQTASLMEGGTITSSREASASTGQVKSSLAFLASHVISQSNPSSSLATFKASGKAKPEAPHERQKACKVPPGSLSSPRFKAASRDGATWQQKQSKP
jgi:hypothetical protein